jgi:hypothetical protein
MGRVRRQSAVALIVQLETAGPRLCDALAAIDIRSFDDLLREFWGGPSDLRQHLQKGPLLTDDRPILEYFLAMPRDKEIKR